MLTNCYGVVLMGLCAVLILCDNENPTTSRPKKRQKCLSGPLDVRVDNADLIFSGKVVHVFPKDDTGRYQVKIEIKRAFKGSSPDTILEIVVQGFGNKELCSSKSRIGDTRIFFTKILPEGGYFLSATIMRLTVRNLDRLKSMVCGKSIEENQVAHTNQTSPTEDIPYQIKPATIQEYVDPCQNVTCRPGARCVSNGDGVTCECVTECPNSRGDPTHLVCGTDGKEYASSCDLEVHSCKTNKDIQVRYRGQCDPCRHHVCEQNQVCQLNDTRVPTCRCGGFCSSEFQPVCASDGKTYTNECIMMVEACKARKVLRIMYRGDCSSGVNLCSSISCHPREECSINKLGAAECRCPPSCEPIMVPVCGTDGKTYDSECHLMYAACMKKKTTNVTFVGLCGDDDPCRTHECEFGSKCSTVRGKPTCQCPSCTNELEQVCGTDKVTYSNACMLQKENCKRRSNIGVLYKGSCDGCENIHCDFYSICQSDDSSLARCVCPNSCLDQLDTKVCGTDGVTYKNECELKMASCKQQTFIERASKGDCDLCRHVQCKYGARCEDGVCICPTDCPSTKEPVCGSDGVTYGNECLLQKESCDKPMRVLFFGDCKDSPGRRRKDSDPHVCDGLLPLINPHTLTEYDCVNNDSCPNNSFCEKHKSFSRCCPKVSSCSKTPYGCCPDNQTPALGINFNGCPSICKCNKLGSYGDTCSPETGQCDCKPGVGGIKCDRCESGFWGLHEIKRGNKGCIPCGCSLFGSIRNDCEQMTGRCICKTGVLGQKCNQCPNQRVLTARGCETIPLKISHAKSCEDKQCYFGGECREDNKNRPYCHCPSSCPDDISAVQKVCASDGNTYKSDCHLKLEACHTQRDIVLVYLGSCTGNTDLSSTALPLRKSTPFQYTEADDQPSFPFKSTRHLSLMVDNSFHSARIYDEAPTLATPKKQGSIGSRCRKEKECDTPHTSCVHHRCQCQPGFTPSSTYNKCIKASSLRYYSSSINDTEGLGYFASGFPYSPKIPVEETGNEVTFDLIDEYNASTCYPNPCHEGGSCVDLGTKGFECICPPGRKGYTCKTVTGFQIPAFAGHSFVKMKKLKAYMKLSISLEFKTLAQDGILLYNQQKEDGTGDFVSLALINGFAEFRYNLGSGQAVIKSRQPIQTQTWHKITIKRYHKDGMFQLDNHQGVSGKSQGTLSSLDLQEHLYLGYVPTLRKRVFENIGTSMGLVGCVRSLIISRHKVDLSYMSSSDVLEVGKLGECGRNPCESMPCHNHGICMSSNETNYKCVCQEPYTGNFCEKVSSPCLSNPCSHGATCADLPKGDFVCKCPLGRTGRRCDLLDATVHEIFIPDFHHSSYMELPRLENVARSFSIEVWFLSRELNGMILYNGELESGRGDFISVNLVQGHVEFRFDLGSGLAKLTSQTAVSLGVWHTIKITRVNREGTLQLDDGMVIRGNSPPYLSELNLDLPLYIGGVKPTYTLNRGSGIKHGLDGAIQRIIINGQSHQNLVALATTSHDVTKYNGLPCVNNPCQNGGICQPNLSSFTCKCPFNFIGIVCEKDTNKFDNDRPLRLHGEGYLKYPNHANKGKGERRNHYTIRFKTYKRNGLLLWISKGSSISKDYLAVAIVEGYPELSFNLGKQRKLLAIQSRVKVDDGEWHKITVARRKRLGIIKVDGEEAIKGFSAKGAKILNTDGRLYIGGAHKLPAGLPAQYYEGFEGCIASVSIYKHQVSLIKDGDNNILDFCEVS